MVVCKRNVSISPFTGFGDCLAIILAGHLTCILKNLIMKRSVRFDQLLLITRYYLVKVSGIILDPLNGIPLLDFNNQYDSNML